MKSVGGLDTVGIAIGHEAIVSRVKSELSSVLPEEQTAQLMDGLTFHENDANDVWWTSQLDFESKGDLQSRVDEFLNFVRYNEVCAEC